MPAGRPKGSGGVNKSAAIRDYLNSHPEASTTEVMEALGKKGIDVSQALVAGVRARAFSGTPGNKRRNKSENQGEITPSEMKAVHAVVEKFEEPEMILSIIEEVCGLIKSLGSVDRLQKALSEYKPMEEVESNIEVTESEIDDDESEDSDSDDEDEDSDED